MSNDHVRCYESSDVAITGARGARFSARNLERASKKDKSAVAALVLMWVAYVATIVLNAVFEGGRLGGVSSADVAYGEVFTWFTPAGYVFSIWGLIYAGLAVWLISRSRQLWLTMKGGSDAARGSSARGWVGRSNLSGGMMASAERSTSGTMGAWYVPVLFIASCALNVIWLALWHLQFIAASVVVIIALFAVLTLLYKGVRAQSATFWGWAPISLYTAWAGIATVSNICILATRVSDGGFAMWNEICSVVLAAVVLGAGLFILARFGDMVIPLVALWAMIGVSVHVAPASMMVTWVIIGLCVVAVVAGIWVFANQRRGAHQR